MITNKIQDQGLDMIQNYIDETKHLGIDKYYGFGTQAFRTAKNGYKYINLLEK